MATARTLNILLNFGGKRDETGAAMLFMVDVSGSMQGEPILQVRAALSRLIHQRREADRVAVMTFCDATERVADFSTHPEYIEEQIADIAAREAVTRLYDAIKDGVDWLGEQATDLRLIVLLSDGQDCGPSTTTAEQCIELARQHEVCLYTIGYSTEGPAAAGMQVLERFAHETGGRFFCAPSADQLPQFFEDAFVAAQTDLEINIRKRVRSELFEIDPNSEVWSRFLSIDTYADGPVPRDSSLERDNPYLFLQTAARTRREMFADFAAKFLAQQPSGDLLETYVREVLLRQGQKAAEERETGIAAGERETGVNVFVVGRVNDLLTLSAAVEVARQVRKVRHKFPDLFLSALSVVGLFVLHHEARWTDEEQRNIHAWLAELDQQQRDRIASPFDRVVFMSSNNAHPANNPGGFVSLTDSRSREMLVETLAALNASANVIGEETSPVRANVNDLYNYLSIGEVALHLNQNHILQNSANAYGADLLKGMYELAPDHGRARTRVNEFFQSQFIEFAKLKDQLLRVTNEQEDALQRVGFEMTEFWPYDEAKKKRYPSRQHYLAHLPYDLRQHAEFVLAQKLRRFRTLIAENQRRVVAELASAIEHVTELELRQTPQSHPVQAEQWIESLYDKVKKEHDDFKARKADEELSTKYFTFRYADLEVREEAPDIGQAYKDMIAQIEKMPLPEAIYARYGFLGLISMFAIDKAVALVPNFLLNIGPLRLPMVLGVLVFLLFMFIAWRKHLRAERQLAYFIKYYAMAMQKKAYDEAIEVLKAHLNQTYTATLKRIGEPSHADAGSEMGQLQALRVYLSTLQSAMRKRTERHEAVSLFHVSALGELSGDSGRASLPILEHQPQLGYSTTTPLDWQTEMRELVTSDKKMFTNWRAMALVGRASRLPEWERINAARLKFKAAFFDHAIARFASDIHERAQLHALLAANRQAHNDRVYRRLMELCYSPVYSEEATPIITRYWAIEAGPFEMLRGDKIFPELSRHVYKPSSDASHLRLFTTMNFELEDIPFFSNCKAAYEACADQSSLHLEPSADASAAAANQNVESLPTEDLEL